MKIILLALCMAMSFTCARAQANFEAAKKEAAENNELILLNFSGSDWCIPCIKLHKNIIASEDFKKLSDDKVIVYMNADFPRNRKNQLAADLKKENAMLADLYNPKGIFPYTLLLDPHGKVIKTWEGLPAENALSFSNEIRAIYQHKK
ncbi:thioredoxin family protein [uncultured Chryseobacterium sp.]|uniref:thioredoxin family protein n=1 Tax=uncultured Chryseobacterium sp. TaxID=259322 RepID=UPI0025EF5E2F|nr:thioredoxin family protein [uncultured Chryseobacterium sp.]